MNISNTVQGQRIYPQQIQNDIFTSNVMVNCDPRLKGPKGSVLDVKSKSGKVGVEDNICNLTVANLTVTDSTSIANLTVTESTSGAGAGVTQILPGNNITLGPPSGTGVVTINATGGGGGGLPTPLIPAYGQYLYHDDPAATNSWLVGGDKIHIGARAGQTNQGNDTIAIGPDAATTDQNSGAIAIGHDAAKTQQGANAVAIGNTVANTTVSGQGEGAVAIGYQSGGNGAVAGQGVNSIAIGYQSGAGQTDFAIAIGSNTASNQGQEAIAIGRSAASAGQGNFSVAIGGQADIAGTSQANCLMFNTTGTAVKHTVPNEWKVATKALDLATPANGGLIQAANGGGFPAPNRPSGADAGFTHYLVYNPGTGEIKMCPFV